jgi:glutamate formiminotransferase/formiminotetrahydrofolate cyclodeaminase
MDAFGLPKSTPEEKENRKNAIQDATKYAIEIPFKVMKTCYESMELIKQMAEIGNPNSVSDAGVGAIAARSGVIGAFLNVKINCAGLDDKLFVNKLLAEGSEIERNSIELENKILTIVNKKISKE